jgi:hypothetical protein
MDRIYPYIHHIYTCFIQSLHHKFIYFIHYIHYKCSPNLLNSYKSTIILCRNKNKTIYHSMPISAESQVQEILFPFPLLTHLPGHLSKPRKFKTKHIFSESFEQLAVSTIKRAT